MSTAIENSSALPQELLTKEAWTEALNSLSSSQSSHQITSFQACWVILNARVFDSENEGYIFPESLLKELLLCILNLKTINQSVLTNFRNYMVELCDVRLFSLEILKDLILEELKKGKPNHQFQNNVFDIISKIPPVSPEFDFESFIGGILPDENSQLLQPDFHASAFDSVWLAFLRLPLSPDLLKRVLLILEKKVIPRMKIPKLLLGFLTYSYNLGGVISLLALNSLFILIQEHNLDFPDFYPKLYTLFDRNVCHVRYRSRFFFLADTFLSASNLPAYITAAFAKRICRLALTAPPAAIMSLLPLVFNILKRYPSCHILIHNTQAGEFNDEFQENEADLKKCNALTSSLWELEALEQHYLPEVSKLAKLFREKLDSKPMMKIEEYLDESYETLFKNGKGKKLKLTKDDIDISRTSTLIDVELFA